MSYNFDTPFKHLIGTEFHNGLFPAKVVGPNWNFPSTHVMIENTDTGEHLPMPGDLVPKIVAGTHQVKFQVMNGDPIVNVKSGIAFVYHKYGFSQWLDHWGEIQDVSPEEWMRLMRLRSADHLAFKKQKLASQDHDPLRCTICGKKLTSIIGYRKHVSTCKERK